MSDSSDALADKPAIEMERDAGVYIPQAGCGFRVGYAPALKEDTLEKVGHRGMDAPKVCIELHVPLI